MLHGGDAPFDQLLDEASRLPVDGWDFTSIGDRFQGGAVALGYERLVVAAARSAEAMLDLGTGGGEWLAALRPRPRSTTATEAWPPNLALARRRLAPLGVEVVSVDPAPDNGAQASGADVALPFADVSFDLICDRHEAFVATEVARVLRPGGRFITQQVTGDQQEQYRRLLGLPVAGSASWNGDVAAAQLRAAGLRVDHLDHDSSPESFADVGALVWYLRKIPWCVPEFTVDGFRDRLRAIDRVIRADGPLVMQLQAFVVGAHRPPRGR